MKCKLLVAFVFFTFLTVSSVCAVDADNLTFQSYDDLNYNDALSVGCEKDLISDNQDDEKPDVPDLIVHEDKHVNPSNINQFFEKGVLKKEFKGETLIFSGNFDDLGALTINRDNVNVIGENAYFKNTVFNIQANGITLKNLTFALDKSIRSNNGAAILVGGYDVTLDTLDVSYVVPKDVEAYVVLADGYNGYSSENLKIINSNIYFEGHNDNVYKYNCAIKLTYAGAVIIENNTVRSSLPLKKVNYGTDGATLDSDYVYAIGLEECPDFIIKNNTIIIDVNKRNAVEYPTLNGIMLSRSDNGLFLNNSLYMTDFVTFPGIENYIYGLDIYKLNNLLVMNNKISIITTGGKLALGTAYPIQVCGPISGVNITKNDLYSFSNGPNIGIYSQNYYGETYISITNNKINVTGLAGTHEWALVTGIESQDTSAEILNNVIEVHSVSEVNGDDNLYAISYRQSTAKDHSFNIQNNVAYTDGFYAVYLLSSDDSVINDNLLISFNEKAVSGSNSYREGPREHNGDEYSNNNVINAKDYYGYENPIIIESYEDHGNIRYIDGGNIGQNNQNKQSHNYNPMIPSYSNTPFNPPINDNEESGKIDEYQDDGSIQGFISDESVNDLKHEKLNPNYFNPVETTAVSVESDAIDGIQINIKNDFDVDGISSKVISNSSSESNSVGLDGNPLNSARSAGSPSEAQSVKKSYELKTSEDEFIPSTFLIVLACLLLAIGYKRKDKNNFE